MFTAKFVNDVKSNQKLNSVAWTHDLKMEAIKAEFEPSKPLISILDLGKLLLKNSRDGDIARVQELVSKGAPFNADWLGMTPLHYAAKRNNYEICDILLRGGINKDAKTKVDRTPLHFAVYEGNREVVELLLARNVDVNVRDMLRMTALHWAVEKKHKAIARLLLKHGAEVAVLSKFDKTPMSIAVQTGQPDLLHDLELARQAQKTGNSAGFDSQQNQSETNDAVNSIALNSHSTPTFDLTNLAEEAMRNSNDDKVASSNKPTNRILNSSLSKGIGIARATSDEINNEDDFVEPIVQLMDDSKESMDESALEMLKHHGITMLPNDDPQNNMLTSALEGGRKLVLSEAGKLVLKETKQNKNADTSVNLLRKISPNQFLQSAKSSSKKPVPIVVRSKGVGVPLKRKYKNIKIITMDMYKQMYGGETGSANKNATRPISTESMPSTKITKLVKINNSSSKKPMVQEIDVKEFRQQTMHLSNSTKMDAAESENDDLPPNIIEVCSESDPYDEDDDDDDNDGQIPTRNSIKISSLQSSSFPASKPVLAVAPQVHSEIPTLDIPEISRQLYDLRKETDELRRQLEIVQRENEDYKIRLERFENDQEDFA